MARQEEFLREYDVCAVSSGDYEKLFLATFGETDPEKSLLLNRKGLRRAKLLFPTKAETTAYKLAAWNKEEERRRSLGFPSQSVGRDYMAEQPLSKPHYEHLKAGIKVPTCWLCDQNNAEQNRGIIEIWGQFEREEAKRE